MKSDSIVEPFDPIDDIDSRVISDRIGLAIHALDFERLEEAHGHAQQFLSVHGQCNTLFRLGRHLLRAAHYRELRSRAFQTWSQVTYAQ
jgi:hypothetical protein